MNHEHSTTPLTPLDILQELSIDAGMGEVIELAAGLKQARADEGTDCDELVDELIYEYDMLRRQGHQVRVSGKVRLQDQGDNVAFIARQYPLLEDEFGSYFEVRYLSCSAAGVSELHDEDDDEGSTLHKSDEATTLVWWLYDTDADRRGDPYDMVYMQLDEITGVEFERPSADTVDRLLRTYAPALRRRLIRRLPDGNSSGDMLGPQLQHYDIQIKPDELPSGLTLRDIEEWISEEFDPGDAGYTVGYTGSIEYVDAFGVRRPSPVHTGEVTRGYIGRLQLRPIDAENHRYGLNIVISYNDPDSEQEQYIAVVIPAEQITYIDNLTTRTVELGQRATVMGFDTPGDACRFVAGLIDPQTEQQLSRRVNSALHTYLKEGGIAMETTDDGSLLVSVDDEVEALREAVSRIQHHYVTHGSEGMERITGEIFTAVDPRIEFLKHDTQVIMRGPCTLYYFDEVSHVYRQCVLDESLGAEGVFSGLHCDLDITRLAPQSYPEAPIVLCLDRCTVRNERGDILDNDARGRSIRIVLPPPGADTRPSVAILTTLNEDNE